MYIISIIISLYLFITLIYFKNILIKWLKYVSRFEVFTEVLWRVEFSGLLHLVDF